MSLSFYLCRTNGDVGPMSSWEKIHALPLGMVDDIKARITALFPDIRWTPVDVAGNTHWFGLGQNAPGKPYLDLGISADRLAEDGPADQVHFVVGRKMPPSLMRILLEGLDLNHVSCPDTGDLVDPYGYTDEDRYFAKKAWPAA